MTVANKSGKLLCRTREAVEEQLLACSQEGIAYMKDMLWENGPVACVSGSSDCLGDEVVIYYVETMAVWSSDDASVQNFA